MELKYLAEEKDQLKESVADLISNLKVHLKYPKCKVLGQPDVKTPSINYMPIMF